MKPFSIALVVVYLTTANCVTNPSQCPTTPCPDGEVCKERAIICFTTQCEPERYCAPMVRPGVCPASDGSIGICVAECTDDSDCLEDFKCCGSCPRKCENVNPCQTIDCQDGYICKLHTVQCLIGPCPPPEPYCAPTVRPGVCPAQDDSIGICVAECTDDSDCYEGFKCCGSCPRKCENVNPCQTIDCQDGYICQLRTVQCLIAPCPPPEPYCAPTTVDCSTKPETGHCKASIERWNYNTLTDSCETFTYGGCGGNDNNYATESDCHQACKPALAVDCSTKPETGHCEALIERWNYNTLTDSCETFTYGGCGGNGNNYFTESDCNHACKPEPIIPRPGICPTATIHSSIVGICVADCDVDTDCPDTQKCCGSCPRTCTDPILEKPGTCHVWSVPCIDGSTDECTDDSQCDGQKKCCKIACHNTCIYPFVMTLF